MANATFDIAGATGQYTLTIERLSSPLTVGGASGLDIRSDVVVQYGEARVDGEPKSVLKSSLTATFFDPRGNLADEVESGPLNCTLEGPGAHWRGRLTPRRALRPLNYRTRPGELRLSFYDGLADLQTESETTSVLARDPGFATFGPRPTYGRALANAGSAVVDLIGGAESDYAVTVYTNVELDNFAGTTFGQSDLVELTVQESYDQDSLLEDLRQINATLQTRAFRRFDDAAVVLVPAAPPTGSFSATKYYLTDTSSFELGSSSVATEATTVSLPEKTVRRLDDKTQYGYHPFENSGAVRYSVTDYNLLKNPTGLKDTGTGISAFWVQNDDVDELTDKTAVEGTPDADAGLHIGYNGTSVTATQTVGDTRVASTYRGGSPARLLLQYEGHKLSPRDTTPSLDVTLRFTDEGGTVTTASVSGSSAWGDVALDLAISDPGTIEVEITGTEASLWGLQLRFLDAGQKIAEDIIVQEPDRSGVRDVEETGAVEEPTASGYEIGTYRNTRYSVSGRIPIFFNATDRLRRRPRSGTALRTRVQGLHGPETRLLVENPNSGKMQVFYAGIGRKINVTQGWTELADLLLPPSADQ